MKWEYLGMKYNNENKYDLIMEVSEDGKTEKTIVENNNFTKLIHIIGTEKWLYDDEEQDDVMSLYEFEDFQKEQNIKILENAHLTRKEAISILENDAAYIYENFEDYNKMSCWDDEEGEIEELWNNLDVSVVCGKEYRIDRVL